MTAAVVFEGVSKKFLRGERHDSLRDLVPAALGRILRRRSGEELGVNEFWALRDVSFEVAPGRALGIIGPNGAGKSTTLKLLTKILKPTTGRCRVVGRCGALIEVSSGFHPELTGRENIFLQGAIMGMRREEIAREFANIVDFAGVAAFLDTPVKRYSSGMNARLGFSIAAHLKPDVLIIDEVLSVGDAAFQQKCVERMVEFKHQGVTIVFVSHNLQAISTLCDNAVYLATSVKASGRTDEVLRHYVTSSTSLISASGDRVEIRDPALSDQEGQPVSSVVPGTPLKLRVTYVIHETFPNVHFGFIVYRSTDNLLAYGGNFAGEEVGLPGIRAGQTLTIEFSFVCHLTRGQYHIECHAYDNASGTHLARLSPAALLHVSDTRTYGGVADLAAHAKLVSSPKA